MTSVAHPGDHKPVIPEIAGQPIGQPLRCAKCGAVLTLVCGDAPAASGTAAIVDRAPDPATTEKAKRTYKPKPCVKCARDFTPTGPRDDICGSCRGGARG